MVTWHCVTCRGETGVTEGINQGPPILDRCPSCNAYRPASWATAPMDMDDVDLVVGIWKRLEGDG